MFCVIVRLVLGLFDFHCVVFVKLLLFFVLEFTYLLLRFFAVVVLLASGCAFVRVFLSLGDA